MQIACDFRSLRVSCPNKKTDGVDPSIIAGFAVPYSDELFKQCVGKNTDDCVVKIEQGEASATFEGVFGFKKVSVVQTTGERSGGEFIEFKFTAQYVAELFVVLEKFHGNDINLLAEKKQAELPLDPPE